MAPSAVPGMDVPIVKITVAGLWLQQTVQTQCQLVIDQACRQAVPQPRQMQKEAEKLSSDGFRSLGCFSYPSHLFLAMDGQAHAVVKSAEYGVLADMLFDKAAHTNYKSYEEAGVLATEEVERLTGGTSGRRQVLLRLV
eukprot:2082324-Amphidinium_carterae.3